MTKGKSKNISKSASGGSSTSDANTPQEPVAPDIGRSGGYVERLKPLPIHLNPRNFASDNAPRWLNAIGPTIKGPDDILQPSSLPAHSISSDTPVKSRMRVSKACTRCRSQKIKCSGTFPCTTCLNHNRECFYGRSTNSNTPDANGSRKEISKRRKLAAGEFSNSSPSVDDMTYIKYLENRVKHLENRVADNLENSGAESNNLREPIDTQHNMKDTKARYGLRLVGKIANEICQTLYDELSPESKSMVTVPRKQFFGWNMSGTRYLMPDTFPKTPDLDVNLNEAELLNYYFEFINPLFAILHESVFRKQYNYYNETTVRDEPESDNLSEVNANETKLFSALFKLLLALSIRFQQMQAKEPSLKLLEVEEKLFKYGYKVMSVLTFECSSFELIQGWLLVALYLRCTYRQTSYNVAMGNATTMSRSMGLGISRKIMSQALPYERTKAKRVFWSVYCIDRLFAAQYGRPPFLGEEYSMIEFPSYDFERESENDDWITLPSFAMIHIAKIANRIQKINPLNADARIEYIMKMLSELKSWLKLKKFSPEDLYGGESKADSLVKAQVYAHYLDLIYWVVAPNYSKLIERLPTTTSGSDITLLEANQEVVKLHQKSHQAGLLFTPWYLTIYSLFTAAVMALTMVNLSFHVSESKKVVADVLQLLYVLRNSPVKDNDGSIVVQERFKMVKESIWAIKSMNHIITLRMTQDLSDLNTIGIDHGPADINKSLFSEMGRRIAKSTPADGTGNADPRQQDANGRIPVLSHTSNESIHNLHADTTPWLPDTISPLAIPDASNSFTASLDWFNRWVDSGDPL